MTVMAFAQYRTNAELILALRDLGYLADDWLTLDPTWGRGTFWKLWQPVKLISHDLEPDGIDFRDMAYPDGMFDAVVSDPPYGYRGTSRLKMDEAYGIAGDYLSVADRNALIVAGVTECARVTKPGGYLMVKAQDQVVSGSVQWQVRMCIEAGEAAGCRHVDLLHFESYMRQPEGRRQVHARRNYSSMIVLRKDRKR